MINIYLFDVISINILNYIFRRTLDILTKIVLELYIFSLEKGSTKLCLGTILCPFHCWNIAPEIQAAAAAAAAGDVEGVQAGRHYMALLDAVDGRFEDALDTLGRLAEKRPYLLGPRLAAAAVCDLLGRPDQGDRCLTGITVDQHPLGGATDAVAGSQGAVASAALMFIYESCGALPLTGTCPS